MIVSSQLLPQLQHHAFLPVTMLPTMMALDYNRLKLDAPNKHFPL